jgi:hypothetical protein
MRPHPFYKHLTQNYKCTTITHKWETPESRDDDGSLSSVPSSPHPSPTRQSAPTTTTTTATTTKKKDPPIVSLSDSSHSKRKQKQRRR